MKKYIIPIIITLLTISLFSSCSIFKQQRKVEDIAWDIEWEDESSARIISKEEVKVEDRELADYYESWLGTPHRMGGMTKDGVDCSGFVYNVYKDVYKINLPRTADAMSKTVNALDLSQMEEGDLVFFKNSNSKKAHHVGIYLEDNNFVHTSSSRGVMISNLSDKYWSRLFYLSGRHPEKKSKEDKL